MEPGQQIHGYLDQAGVAANIITETASGEWMVRADSMESLTRAVQTFRRSFEAGAVATGATLSMTTSEHPYSAMTSDDELGQLFFANAQQLGRDFTYETDHLGGSSDIANVSNFFPTIQPMIGVGADAPDIHTAPFAAYAGGPEGDSASFDGALLLALTAVDAALDPSVRARLISLPAPDTSVAGTELDPEGEDDDQH